MRIHNSSLARSLPDLVLFPFDDHSIPFQDAVQLNLISHSTPCGRTRKVLEPGPEGAPDSLRVVYYGAVRKVGDEYWMWYLGQGHDDTWFERVCLATSRDGYHWERPNLGLVEYRGSRDNNLVDLYGGQRHVQSCVVFHEPDDPDPNRRFKMAYQTREYRSRFAVAYSPDGLRWTPSPNNPVGTWLEMSGGARINGCYYLTGQGGNHAGGLRQLVTFVSYDFENWLKTSALGLRRHNLPPTPRLLRPQRRRASPPRRRPLGPWQRRPRLLRHVARPPLQ